MNTSTAVSAEERTYTVTVSEKQQAAGECASAYEIDAKNKKEAISKARKLVGYRSRYDSALIYRAEVRL